MSLEIIEDLEKLVELKFTPATHIVGEVEKVIQKIKTQMGISETEEEQPVTLNGSPISLENDTEPKKKTSKTRTYIPKASFKTVTEEEGAK